MHVRIPLDDEAHRRAVDGLRAVRATPDLAARWAALDPVRQLGYVIVRLLNLPGPCCEYHAELSGRIVQRYLSSRACPHVAVRRRASEILAAVALVDQLPPCTPLEPPRIEHGTS